MSRLRPELRSTTTGDALPDDTALYLIRDAVVRRGALCYGKLDDGALHCALGAFWQDHPRTTLHTSLVDEVAAVNDLKKDETPRQRWMRMRSWLRWKVRVLAGGKP